MFLFSSLNLFYSQFVIPKNPVKRPNNFFMVAVPPLGAQLHSSRLYLREFQNHFVFLGQHLHFVFIDIFWKRECSIERRLENTLR